MTYYDNNIRELIWNRDWPKGLVVDIVEHPELLEIRLYQDNLNKFDMPALQQITNELNAVLKRIRLAGVPCDWDKWETVPHA